MIEGLTYDDVLIVPAYSDILTRADIDIRNKFLGEYRLPIVSAPMDTISGPEMVARLSELGAYGILHRFSGTDTLAENVYDARTRNFAGQFGVSIGVKDWESTLAFLNYVKLAKPHSICIDVAHGHHALVWETINNVKEWAITQNYPIEIIAGNVATAEGFAFLASAGATAVRVGIGPGSVCTTRETTGVGYPQLSALQDIHSARNRERHDDVSIIADGGIKSPGDIAKALAAGADAVMLGRMFAGTDETPGIVHYGKKPYRGQSTVGTNGERDAPEGISGTVEAIGPVEKVVNQLVHYLRSSFSYVGARNLEEFRVKARFVRVSPSTFRESGTRL